eukprot:63591_1
MATRFTLMLFITKVITTYSKQCKTGQDCVIHCGSDNATSADSAVDCINDTTINGTTATFLSFLCQKRSDCNGYNRTHHLVINCPIAGCNFTCAKRGCEHTVINLAETESKPFSSPSTINLHYVNLDYAIINAPHADNLHLNWNTMAEMAGDRGCAVCQLNAQFANKVVINVNNGDSYRIKDSIFNVSYAKSVEFNTIGDDAFQESSLHAEHAQSASITMSADKSSATFYGSSRLYVPWNTIWNCYGTGCNGISTIDIGTNISEAQFDINVFTCGQCALNGNADVSRSVCLNLDQFGTAYNLSYTLPSANDDSLCYVSRALESHYTWYSDQVHNQSGIESICEEGRNCVMDCNDTNITCHVYVNTLDATKFSHLTLICDDCYDSVILCPDKGCDIECVGEKMCFHVYLVYNGAAEDVGVINITCRGERACSYLTIEAHHVHKLILVCDGDRACDYADVYALYANDIHIAATTHLSAHRVRVSAHYANYVRVGPYFSPSSLFAEYAQSVMIECLRLGCYESYFYVPINTSVYAELNGLYGSGIFVQSGVQNLRFGNYNFGCNASDYFEKVQFGCGYAYTTVVSDCGEECGCQALMDSIQNCTDLETLEDETLSGGAIVGIVIGCIGAVVIVIGLCMYFRKKDEREMDESQPQPSSDDADNNERESILNSD